MLLELESIWNRPLAHVLAAQRKNEKLLEITRLIHSAPYRALTKAREFEKNEIEMMIELKLIELARIQVGISCRSCSENEQHAAILCPPQISQHSNCVRFVSYSALQRGH